MKQLTLAKYHFESHLILNHLPPEDADFLESKMTFRNYHVGQSIFIEGSYPSGVFLLKQGKVKKFKLDRDGNAQIFYICVPGDLLGHPALLSEEPYSDSASAIEACEIGFIPKSVFFQLLSNSKTFSHQILKNISHEFGVLVNIISVYTHQSSRERMALSLLILNEKFNAGNTSDTSLPINLSREDMANMVGVAVETLVRLLNDFKTEKIITAQSRKIFIINPNKLMGIIRQS